MGVLEESQSPCYCHMFAPSDYRTMIISTIGEIARKCLSLLGGSLFWVGTGNSKPHREEWPVIYLAPAW